MEVLVAFYLFIWASCTACTYIPVRATEGRRDAAVCLSGVFYALIGVLDTEKHLRLVGSVCEFVLGLVCVNYLCCFFVYRRVYYVKMNVCTLL